MVVTVSESQVVHPEMAAGSEVQESEVTAKEDALEVLMAATMVVVHMEKVATLAAVMAVASKDWEAEAAAKECPSSRVLMAPTMVAVHLDVVEWVTAMAEHSGAVHPVLAAASKVASSSKG